MDLTQFPTFSLVHRPTPLEYLARLSAVLDGPQIYIKRDDCTGLAFGGNKTRKLEFLIGEALEKGATTLVTVGSMQSNHVRQAAAAAVKAGLKCELVLDWRVPWTDPAYGNSGNILLDRLLGAKVHLCGKDERRNDKAHEVMADIEARGEKGYFIPTGGSNAVGSLGYVDCALEIIEQAQQQNIKVNHVVVASGSGGTQAGMMVGLASADSAISCIGIDIDHDPVALRAEVSSVAAQTARLMGVCGGVEQDKLELVEGYGAPEYGMPNDKTIEAITLLAQTEAIILDPVYTGKAMAGLIDMIANNRFGKDEVVVFAHTGGGPGLFAYSTIFEKMS
jgi:L-cysteate sulfo-lyase